MWVSLCEQTIDALEADCNDLRLEVRTREEEEVVRRKSVETFVRSEIGGAVLPVIALLLWNSFFAPKKKKLSSFAFFVFAGYSPVCLRCTQDGNSLPSASRRASVIGIQNRRAPFLCPPGGF